ncbi:PREDICTED: exopolygalacturonase-like, partial [Nelumbo nucifera]|uniref:Exopolygalacturonase-like n=1 Tax=Nelumbo nucifera TaxID=4432 RepID=A0A1U7ZJV3_NELNU
MEEAQNGVFDITAYGGKDGGDITQAVMDAWKAACAATGAATVLIPKGTYTMNLVNLAGPCKQAQMNFQLEGIVQAPADPAAMDSESWLLFDHVDDLTVFGGGTLDGQGQKAWESNECSKNSKCPQMPANLRLNFVNNGVVHDITSLNSKMIHIMILSANNLTIQHVTITAPSTSINTDGIHIGRSTGVKILDTTIGTGDDCVSVSDGNKDITVSKVTCGPGHGLSIGSLGKYDNEGPVVGVHISDCTLTKTDNGVRIKSWPDSKPGSASDISFENIVMNDVGNPVIIDQAYCPYGGCSQAPSRVKLSNIKIAGIKGTSSTQEAVKIFCSPALPCENVEIGDINLAFSGGAATCTCANTKPTLTGTQVPPV